jgi:modulator of FtsH protease
MVKPSQRATLRSWDAVERRREGGREGEGERETAGPPVPYKCLETPRPFIDEHGLEVSAMNGPSTAGWENFFVAEVGAAAALTGLLFVAVSINLARILAIEHLPSRAGETLVVLAGALAVATFGLVPDQGHIAFGCEVGVTGLLVWAATVRTQWKSYRYVDARPWLAWRVVGTQVASLPFVVGGILLVEGSRSALFWVVAGVLASFASGMQNAWVLLVEILR